MGNESVQINMHHPLLRVESHKATPTPPPDAYAPDHIYVHINSGDKVFLPN